MFTLRRFLIPMLLGVMALSVYSEAAPRRVRRFRPVRVRRFVNPFFFNNNVVNLNDFSFNRFNPQSDFVKQDVAQNNPTNVPLDAQLASGAHSIGFNGVDPQGRGGAARPVDLKRGNNGAGEFGLGLQDSNIFQSSVVALSRREVNSRCAKNVVLGADGRVIFQICSRIGDCTTQEGGFVGQFEVSRIRSLVAQAKTGTLKDVGQGGQCRQALIEETFVGDGGSFQINKGQLPCGTVQRNDSSATPGLIQVLRNLERRFDTRLNNC